METSNNNDLEQLFLRVEFEDVVEQALEGRLLKEAIDKLCSSLNIEALEAYDWVSQDENFSTEAIKRKFGDFILYKLYDQIGDYSMSLEDFTANRRKELAKLGTKASPTLRNLSETSLSPEKPNKKPWISIFINSKREEIRGNFMSYKAKEPDFIEIKSANHCFKDMYEACRLIIPEKDIADFYEITRKHNSSLITFPEFVKMIENWSVSHPKVGKMFNNKLEKSILQFTALKSSVNLYPYNQHLKELIKNMQALSGYSSSGVNSMTKQETKKRVQEVFNFYAKAQHTFGRKPTFDQIEANNTTWNLSKYLKFCTDFEISSVLNKEILTHLFKSTATFTRLMNLSQFENALDRIAEEYFSAQYDENHGTNISPKPLIEKREILYKKLQLNSDKFNKKLKGFGLAFSSEKLKSEIVQRSKYQYKLTEQKRNDLDTWKYLRKNKSELKTIGKDRYRSAPRFEPYLMHNESGYSKRPRRNRRYVQASQSIHNVPEKKPVSFSDIAQYEELAQEIVGNDSDDETQQFLNKIYGASKKNIQDSYAHIMKMQDNLIARGMNIVSKTKKLSH